MHLIIIPKNYQQHKIKIFRQRLQKSLYNLSPITHINPLVKCEPSQKTTSR
jgi:hypothetical protein